MKFLKKNWDKLVGNTKMLKHIKSKTKFFDKILEKNKISKK